MNKVNFEEMDDKKKIKFASLKFLAPIKIANLKDGDSVLDLGAHDGKIMHFINKNIDYTAVDCIETFHGYYPEKKFPNHVINYNLEKGLPPKLKNGKA